MKECVRRLYNTSNWSPYLDMIFYIFTFTRSINIIELSKVTATIFKEVVPQLLHLEQVCDNSHVRERIIEIAFHLPIPFTVNYAGVLQQLIPLCVKALSGPDSLQRSGMYD